MRASDDGGQCRTFRIHGVRSQCSTSYCGAPDFLTVSPLMDEGPWTCRRRVVVRPCPDLLQGRTPVLSSCLSSVVLACISDRYFILCFIFPNLHFCSRNPLLHVYCLLPMSRKQWTGQLVYSCCCTYLNTS